MAKTNELKIIKIIYTLMYVLTFTFYKCLIRNLYLVYNSIMWVS